MLTDANASIRLGMRAERWIRLGIAVLAFVQIAVGLWEAFAPGSFYDAVGGFGSKNAHYVRDVATFTLALGFALLIAVGRRPWRVPVLFIGAVQSVLHVANHILDAGHAHPSWVGPVDVALLAGQAIVFVAVLVASARSRGANA
jgi:hypothetical protein